MTTDTNGLRDQFYWESQDHYSYKGRVPFSWYYKYSDNSKSKGLQMGKNSMPFYQPRI